VEAVCLQGGALDLALDLGVENFIEVAYRTAVGVERLEGCVPPPIKLLDTLCVDIKIPPHQSSGRTA
jgi:hypothetical protein